MKRKSKVLITGGMGFVGSRLAKRLLDEDYQVVIVDNMSYGNFDNAVFDDRSILDEAEFIQEDAHNEKEMSVLFNRHQFDYVFHFASIAPLPDCQLNKLKAINSNTVSTLVILEESRKQGVKRVFLSSTNALYENVDATFPVHEDKDIETTLLYPTAKLMSEQLAKSFNRSYGIPITVFRFANVYGEAMDILRDFPPVTGAFIKAFVNDIQPRIYGNGQQSRDFIYVEDLIDAIILVMLRTQESYEVLNIGSGEKHSVSKQLEIIKKLVSDYFEKNIEDLPKEIYIPTSLFWENLRKADQKSFYKLNEQVLSKEVNKDTNMNITKLVMKYKWYPKYTFEEGLKRTVYNMLDKLVKDKDKS